MKFYVGLHHPPHAQHFARCMISARRLAERRGDFPANEWMLDSGAFTEISQFGMYRTSVKDYAAQIRRWSAVGRLVSASTQDLMCEPFILAKTGLSVADHQRITIERYDALRALVDGVHVLPVLQGFAPAEYVDHLAQYGDRLTAGMWVGVGSVCKRNADMGAIERVLSAIHTERPDLRLHGFGLKTTALQSSVVRDLLHSADSMAWSFAARKREQDDRRRGIPKTGPSKANDWREAKKFMEAIECQPPRIRAVQQAWL
jgi:hypothetical protein